MPYPLWKKISLALRPPEEDIYHPISLVPGSPTRRGIMGKAAQVGFQIDPEKKPKKLRVREELEEEGWVSSWALRPKIKEEKSPFFWQPPVEEFPDQRLFVKDGCLVKAGRDLYLQNYAKFLKIPSSSAYELPHPHYIYAKTNLHFEKSKLFEFAKQISKKSYEFSFEATKIGFGASKRVFGVLSEKLFPQSSEFLLNLVDFSGKNGRVFKKEQPQKKARKKSVTFDFSGDGVTRTPARKRSFSKKEDEGKQVFFTPKTPFYRTPRADSFAKKKNFYPKPRPFLKSLGFYGEMCEKERSAAREPDFMGRIRDTTQVFDFYAHDGCPAAPLSRLSIDGQTVSFFKNCLLDSSFLLLSIDVQSGREEGRARVVVVAERTEEPKWSALRHDVMRYYVWIVEPSNLQSVSAFSHSWILQKSEPFLREDREANPAPLAKWSEDGRQLAVSNKSELRVFLETDLVSPKRTEPKGEPRRGLKMGGWLNDTVLLNARDLTSWLSGEIERVAWSYRGLLLVHYRTGAFRVWYPPLCRCVAYFKLPVFDYEEVVWMDGGPCWTKWSSPNPLKREKNIFLVGTKNKVFEISGLMVPPNDGPWMMQELSLPRLPDFSAQLGKRRKEDTLRECRKRALSFGRSKEDELYVQENNYFLDASIIRTGENSILALRCPFSVLLFEYRQAGRVWVESCPTIKAIPGIRPAERKKGDLIFIGEMEVDGMEPVAICSAAETPSTKKLNFDKCICVWLEGETWKRMIDETRFVFRWRDPFHKTECIQTVPIERCLN